MTSTVSLFRSNFPFIPVCRPGTVDAERKGEREARGLHSPVLTRENGLGVVSRLNLSRGRDRSHRIR